MASRFFGFPRKGRAEGPDRVFEGVRALLLETNRHKQLAFSQIEASHLLVELSQSESKLEPSEAARILDFNTKRFGVLYSAGEARDYRRNWVKKRFFTVGEI
jgi:hypothetical protein